jgi:hypothetical protein
MKRLASIKFPTTPPTLTLLLNLRALEAPKITTIAPSTPTLTPEKPLSEREQSLMQGDRTNLSTEDS